MPAPSIVAAWPFQNTTNDSIGTRHLDEVSGGGTYYAGHLGQAFGSGGGAGNGIAAHQTGAGYAPLSLPLTFTGWFWFTAAGTPSLSFTVKQDAGWEIGIILSPGGTPTADCWAAGEGAVASMPAGWATGLISEWVFVAGGVPASGLAWITVNGSARVTATIAGAGGNFVYVITGGNGDIDTKFIDEFILFSGDLGAADVAWLYNAGTGRTLAAAQAHTFVGSASADPFSLTRRAMRRYP